jgi:HSP20 family protein
LNMLYSTVAEPARQTTWRPAADVYRSSDGWLLKFELAGVAMEDVSVSARGSALTVSGVRRDQMADGNFCQYSMEISYSRFERKIHLPCDIEKATLDIEFVMGILLVHVMLSPEGTA